MALDSETEKPQSDAPVTFINVYESNIFTLGIFIIRKGNSLPLHDHPGMFGVWYVKFLKNILAFFTVKSHTVFILNLPVVQW